MYQLAIILNDAEAEVPCAICGQTVEAFPGPELFHLESRQLVCHKCGFEHAPELLALLSAAQEERLVTADEDWPG